MGQDAAPGSLGTPAVDTLYERVLDLKRAGFLPDLLDRGNRRYTRESAAAAAKAGMEFCVRLPQMLQKSPQFDEGGRQSLAKHFEMTEWLARAVLPEMRALGMTLAEIEARFDRAAEGLKANKIPVRRFREIGFSDVAKGHWADGAVLELKSVGILWGYPDGSFRGG